MLLRTGFMAVLALAAVVVSGCGGGYYALSGGNLARAGASYNTGVAFPSTPVVPPYGVIYTSYKAPLDYRFDNTPVNASKTASLKTTRIGIPWYNLSVAWGDVNYNDLAAAAGLETIHYADYEVFNILTIYSVTTFHLYGE